LKEKLEKKYPIPLMKKDDTQYAAITARVRDKCTDARYTMKQEALDKIGLSPSVEMCGRVAFLVSASYSALSKY
jgi:hypothetical protein